MTISKSRKHLEFIGPKHNRLQILVALIFLIMGLAQGQAADTQVKDWRSLRLSSDPAGKASFMAGSLKGKSRILMVWRADCAPCLVEFQSLGKFERAATANNMELIAVALGPPEDARSKLKELAIVPRTLWYALDPDNDVLVALNGTPPRMPVSVAISAEGILCAARTGFLGTDIIKQWAAQCPSH